jgi:hypothetical protein
MAFAHAGGLEVVAPLASIVLGITLAMVALLLRPSVRAYVAAAPVVACAAFVLGTTLTSGATFTLDGSLGVLLTIVLLFVGPFLAAFGLTLLCVSAIRRKVANWRRVRELLRSDN